MSHAVMAKRRSVCLPQGMRALRLAIIAAGIGTGTTGLAQNLPADLAPILTACINEIDAPTTWTEVPKSDAILTGLTWVDAMSYLMEASTAEYLEEDAAWLDDDVADSFQESSYWVGVDADQDRYRFYSNERGWTAALILGKDQDDYLDGYANCYLWHDTAKPEDIAWVSQWGFFDPIPTLPSPDEPRYWEVRNAWVSAETAYGENSIEIFAGVLEPGIFPGAPRTALMITRLRYQYEAPQ